MIPDIGERKMKRNRIIAMLLGTALLVCGCQQTPKATDEEKKIEAEKNTTKTEEKEYQGKLARSSKGLRSAASSGSVGRLIIIQTD